MTFTVRFLLLILLTIPLHAEDWPQFRGVNRDGALPDSGWLDAFPPQGPTVRWRKPVGLGLSSVVIANGRVFVADAELKPPAVKERLHCFDETTGRESWTFSYDVTYPDWALVPGQSGGPTATPIVEDNRIWMLGINGELHCLDTASGAVIWKRMLNRDYEIPAMICRPSPLIEGNLLILFTGAKPAASVIALDKFTSKEVWKALDEQVLNSSPIAITVGKKRQLIVWTDQSVTALDPLAGTTLWREQLLTNSNFGTATPVFHGHRLLISGLMMEFEDGQIAPKILWQADTKAASNRVLSNTTTPLFRDDHVYSAGMRGQLLCLDAATGKEVWQTGNITAPKNGASININPAGDKAFLFTDEGNLILARLAPSGYQEISRAHVIEPTYPFFGKKYAWTPPSYANGHAFLRTDNEVVCLSLAADK